jgi:hypothetical protein
MLLLSLNIGPQSETNHLDPIAPGNPWGSLEGGGGWNRQRSQLGQWCRDMNQRLPGTWMIGPIEDGYRDLRVACDCSGFNASKMRDVLNSIDEIIVIMKRTFVGMSDLTVDDFKFETD